MNKNHLFFFLFALTCISYKEKQPADLLIYNAVIYTVDSAFSTAEAMAIKDGKILATGTSAALRNVYTAKENIDAKGKCIYPGFIDAHTHFVSYGLGLNTVDLTGTTSWNEVIQRVQSSTAKQAGTDKPTWITGHGWDQNDWVGKAFPDKEMLDSLYPNTPVLLTRIDGHAAIANQRALEAGSITTATVLTGGEVRIKNYKCTGLLIDNAVRLVSNRIPAPSAAQFKNALQAAEKNCFAVGLTTVDDCGLSAAIVEKIRMLQDDGNLNMRMYIMLSDEKGNYAYLQQKGIIKTEKLHVRSFKVYGDGALGSRGACLLEPYTDMPAHTGFLLSNPAHFDSVAAWIAAHGFQMCTHAIGDSANRTMLHIYAKYLKGKNDLRWRIEHAQVVNENDFHLFGDNSIVPSVQPTHATSDMYWAAGRLGNKRIKGAYAYKQLLQQNGWEPLGTDFPVEDISTFKTFYAATIRKDAKGFPAKGFQTENKLSRKEALMGMTIWAAKANFEEQEKGSLEKGKVADFVILTADLLKEAPEKLLNIKVASTFLGGKKVYQMK